MISYPSLHEVRAAADDYWAVWQRLLAAAPHLRRVIGEHTPTALGWKVEGDAAPLEAAGHLYELGDSLYLGPVNGERGILTLRKPQPVALDALQEIKIMQRRPSRPDDALGADSLDFILPHGLPKLEEVQKAAAGAEVTVEAERNEAHAWLSLRYDGHEFKLLDHYVWEVCVREAQELLLA
jgi:hypothetical protein